MLKAVERLEAGERASALAVELNLNRTIIHHWRDQFRPNGAEALTSKRGCPRTPEVLAESVRASRAKADSLAQARAQAAELERKVGQQQLDLDFSGIMQQLPPCLCSWGRDCPATILNLGVPGWRVATAELRVMDALREKRSELNGVVNRLEQRLARHRGSLAHLDATVRLFDPDSLSQDADLVPQRGRVSWFGPGKCRRLTCDVLRDAPQPLATRELAERVMAAKGIPAVDDHRTRALIQKTALASLSRADGTIERTETAGAWSAGRCVRRLARAAHSRMCGRPR